MDRARWAAVRRAVFERDGHRCRKCGAAGRLECDHRVPVNQGGDPWDLAGMQTLCRSCHIAKSRRERRAQSPPEVVAWRSFMGW